MTKVRRTGKALKISMLSAIVIGEVNVSASAIILETGINLVPPIAVLNPVCSVRSLAKDE